MKSAGKTLGWVMVMVLVLTGSATAKPGYGTISGIVLDPSGTPQMGATVWLISEDAGGRTVSQLLSNQHGAFFTDRLKPGKYSLRVSLPGFLPAMERHVSVIDNLTTLTCRSIAGRNPGSDTRSEYFPGLRRSVKKAPCWLESCCETVRPPASSEMSHTVAPICGVPDGSSTMPEIVPYPGLAVAEPARTRTMTMTQPRVLPTDFIGAGYLPVVLSAAALFTAGGVTVKSAERETVCLVKRSVAWISSLYLPGGKDLGAINCSYVTCSPFCLRSSPVLT